MFVLLFKNGNNDATRDYFDEYYMSLLQVKDFHALIHNKPFFDQSVKISKNDVSAIWNFLDFTYHHNYYNLIGIDLSRQINTNIPQQINFTRKLAEDDGTTMSFIVEKQQKTILNFSIASSIITE